MRLKTTQISTVRAELLEAQGGNCPLCNQFITDPVLDHAHGRDRGWIRAVICRQCNLFLGKIEQHKRFSVQDIELFLQNTITYLSTHKTNQTGLIHPSMKTPDEKKALAKKRRQRKLNVRPTN